MKGSLEKEDKDVIVAKLKLFILALEPLTYKINEIKLAA